MYTVTHLIASIKVHVRRYVQTLSKAAKSTLSFLSREIFVNNKSHPENENLVAYEKT